MPRVGGPSLAPLRRHAAVIPAVRLPPVAGSADAESRAAPAAPERVPPGGAGHRSGPGAACAWWGCAGGPGGARTSGTGACPARGRRQRRTRDAPPPGRDGVIPISANGGSEARNIGKSYESGALPPRGCRGRPQSECDWLSQGKVGAEKQVRMRHGASVVGQLVEASDATAPQRNHLRKGTVVQPSGRRGRSGRIVPGRGHTAAETMPNAPGGFPFKASYPSGCSMRS